MSKSVVVSALATIVNRRSEGQLLPEQARERAELLLAVMLHSHPAVMDAALTCGQKVMRSTAIVVITPVVISFIIACAPGNLNVPVGSISLTGLALIVLATCILALFVSSFAGAAHVYKEGMSAHLKKHPSYSRIFPKAPAAKTKGARAEIQMTLLDKTESVML